MVDTDSGRIYICKYCDREFTNPNKMKGHITRGHILKGKPPWNKGLPLPDDVKTKLSIKLKGRIITKEWREKISKGMRGKIVSQATKDKLSQSLKGKQNCKGRILSEETKKKISASHKGKRHSQETKDKLSALNKGQKSPMKDRKLSEETIALLKSYSGSNYRGSRIRTKQWKEKIQKALVKKYQDEEFKNKVISASLSANRENKPNKAELRLLDLLNSLCPNEYKYVGDGQVIIAGKCPDFINVNGQKKIIELFGDYWHRGEDPKDRAKIFKPFGYKTLVIWESELKNIEKIKRRICKFHEL